MFAVANIFPNAKLQFSVYFIYNIALVLPTPLPPSSLALCVCDSFRFQDYYSRLFPNGFRFRFGRLKLKLGRKHTFGVDARNISDMNVI